MINRIKKLMEDKDLTAAQFSEMIGVQRSSLSHVMSGRNKPSLDFVLKIKKRYPDLNLDWILLGEGDMYTSNQLSEPSVNLERKGINLAPAAKSTKIHISNKDQAEGNQEVVLPGSAVSQASETANDKIEMWVAFYKNGSFQTYSNK